MLRHTENVRRTPICMSITAAKQMELPQGRMEEPMEITMEAEQQKTMEQEAAEQPILQRKILPCLAVIMLSIPIRRGIKSF